MKRLNLQKQQTEDEHDALRADLLERFRDGAAVEPGHWDLQVKETQYRQFTFDQLKGIVGIREAERLKGHLIPRRQTIVKVVKSRGGDHE